MPSNPFFEMLGLNEPWPDDGVADCEAKAARLTEKVQRIFDSMVRHQRAMEIRRNEIAIIEKQVESHPKVPVGQSQIDAREKAKARLERNRRILEKHEAAYQLLLAHMHRTKRTLTNLQDQIRSHKLNRK